MARRR